MTFTGKYDIYSESSDEDISEEKLDDTYKLLFTKWKEACLREEKQKKIIIALLPVKEKLDSTIAGL